MSLVVAILMKDPARAKTRLAPVLSLEQRHDLAVLMFRNTLAFFKELLAATPIVAVTPADRIGRIAKAAGVDVVYDAGDGGINGAARCARDWALAAGASSLMLVHADIATLCAKEFDDLIGASRERAVVIGESLDGGTNALIVTPPDAIEFSYGAGSADRHAEAAQRCKLAARRIRPYFLSRDIDRPQDLDLCKNLLMSIRATPARAAS